MKLLRTGILAGTFLPVFILLLTGCGEQPQPQPPPAAAAPAPELSPPAEPFVPDIPEIHVTNGMTERAVVESLGKPTGIMELDGRRMLLYAGEYLELSEGRIVNLSPNFAANIRKSREDAARKEHFKQQQQAKGLVLYNGKWIKPSERDRFEARKKKLKQVEEKRQAQQEALFNSIMIRDENGNPIDHSRLVSWGRITIVDFYADWCAPCRRMAPSLAEYVRSQTSVVLKKVDIGNWGSSTAKQYNVRSVPNLRVFDRKGRLVGPPTSSLQRVIQYVEAAKRRQ